MPSNPSKYEELYCNAQKGIGPGGVNYNKFRAGTATTLAGEYDEALLQFGDGFRFYQDPWQNFDRWYTRNPQLDEVATRQYIFLIRPELYLVDAKGMVGSSGQVNYELSKVSRTAFDPVMQFMKAQHEVVLRSLCGEFGRQASTASSAAASGQGMATMSDGATDTAGNQLTMHAWIPYLVGRAESLQIPDYTLKTFNLVQPYTKYSVPYGTSAIESQSGGTFDIVFQEDRDLRVHKLFFVWLYYMDGVMRNRFRPKDKFILYNALDYVTSVYHIVTDVTANRILWWSKYTGAIPTSVPNSDMSFNRQGTMENTVTIPFQYFHHEAMNPQILTDFNYNSLGYVYMRGPGKQYGTSKLEFVPSYNPETYTMGANYVGRPFISSDSQYNLYLRWMPPIGFTDAMQFS